MGKYYLATWLLSRFLSPIHAEAVLGDLLEDSGASAPRFHRLLLGTLWSLGWRSGAGYVMAAVVGGLALIMLQTAFFGSLPIHQWSPWQQTWGSTLAFVAGSMSIVTCFSAVRYGLRDRMTQVALAMTAIGSLTVLFWWVRYVPVMAFVGLLILAIASLRAVSGRPALAAAATLVVLQPFLWFGGLTLLVSPLALALKHFAVRMGTAKPWIAGWLVVCYFALVMLSCVASAKVHRWTGVSAVA